MSSKWLQDSNAKTNSWQAGISQLRGDFIEENLGEWQRQVRFPTRRGGVGTCAAAVAGHCPPLLGGEALLAPHVPRGD